MKVTVEEEIQNTIPTDSSGITSDILSIQKWEAIEKYGTPKYDYEMIFNGVPEDRWEGIQGDYSEEEIINNRVVVNTVVWAYNGLYDIKVDYHVKVDSISPRGYSVYEGEEMDFGNRRIREN